MSRSRWIVSLLLGALVIVTGCGQSAVPGAPAPVVTGISPVLGPRTGGTEVTITGQNFTPATVATLAEAPIADLTFVDSQTLTGKTPPAQGGTEAGLLVSNASGLSYILGIFYYIPEPTLTSVSPSFGPPPGGIVVTLTGTGFQDYDAGPNTVMVGALPATNVVTLGDTTIECVIPSGIGPATITVTNANGTATKKNGYRYFPPPTVGFITPNEGTPLGGTPVTITGTGFVVNAPGLNEVAIGGSPAANVVIVDDGTITCETPARDGLASVVVTNANGSGTLMDAYTYYPRPTLTAVSPATGSQNGGVTMTLTGSGFFDNFPGTNTVKVGGVNATGVTVVDDTTITCTTPATGVGPLTVSVSNANGTASISGAYTAKLSALVGVAGTTLYRINTANGALTGIGNMGVTVRAIAFHPDGTLYGVTASDLVTINTANGAATSVGTLSPAPALDDLAFKGTRLFGFINTSGATYEINTSTAAVTTKSTFSLGATWTPRRGGLEYYNSQFYTFPYYSYNWPGGGGSTTDAGYIITIDPDSGSYTLSGAYLSGAHAIVALGTFAGTLYAVDHTSGSGGTLTPRLVSINASVTTATIKGSFSQTIVCISGTP